ncbi:hypothetical protein SAMN05444143_101350 [Flavobacterium succinicans]|uniref:Uncharacterized protein n=1 Tax=Flavobacterium succinicans TaxID=29536 RepID=A0A1I4RG34_9FLAO|nr:hypothetical protein [Flavobacterium succinicans]SFM51232.1 hypothetical protein SAMN05444143_101350 [Flavobacterium succinicans]
MSTTYFFSPEELSLLQETNKQKTVTAVFYHLWVNLVQPDNQFIFIDTVELHFENHQKLFFKINEEDTGFSIVTDYDFEKEQQQLAEQFNGTLSLKRVDVSGAPLWVENIKTPLLAIKAEREDTPMTGDYVSITFEAGALEIDYDQESGLTVAVFEDI